MRDIAGEIRVGARSLFREPGISLIAVLMLAVGLGTTITVFSVIDGVLLSPLAYREPERLVTIREMIPMLAKDYPSLPVNARHFLEWRKDCKSLEGIALVESTTINLTGSGEPERLDAARVSPNLFRVLGVRTTVGRDFLDEEEQTGKDRVVVLTDGLWRRRFQADPSLVGRSIMLNGNAHTVVGILPADFRFPDRNVFELGQSVAPRTELFRPKTFEKDEIEEILGRFNYGAIARLKPGATRERAVAELEAVQARMEALAGETVHLKALVRPLLEVVVGKSRRGLLVLMGAVGVVLLIVCVNLANLLLARGERRGREMAVRAALGAGRGRLIRQGLAEAGLIAITGGTLALGAAQLGLRFLIRYAPADIPRLDEVRLDGTAMLFAAVLIAGTTLLFGFLPAWRAGRADPQAALRGGGRGSSSSRGGARLRSTLVACEVGLSALLLFLSGLLIHSYARLVNAEKGYHAPTVLAVDIGLSGEKYREADARDGFFKRVLGDLSSRPDIRAAAICSALPLQGETWVDRVSLTGAQRDPTETTVNTRFVSPDYFRTMGIPMRAGRTLSEGDRKRKVTLISERLASELWPKQDPIGRRLVRGDREGFEVIGVVGDVRAEAHKAPVAMMYRPYWEWMPFRTVLVARAAADPLSIAGTVRSSIRSGDADVPVPRMRTMSEVLDESLAARRFQMMLVGVFAVTALLVASMGIYAVVAYSVARRTAEIGIRAALGAGVAGIYGLVLRQGMAPVVAGLAFGIAGTLAFDRLIGSLLYDVRGFDPLTIVVVTGILAAVGLAACMVPARRAARVDPLRALHYE